MLAEGDSITCEDVQYPLCFGSVLRWLAASVATIVWHIFVQRTLLLVSMSDSADSHFFYHFPHRHVANHFYCLLCSEIFCTNLYFNCLTGFTNFTIINTLKTVCSLLLSTLFTLPIKPSTSSSHVPSVQLFTSHARSDGFNFCCIYCVYTYYILIQSLSRYY